LRTSITRRGGGSKREKTDRGRRDLYGDIQISRGGGEEDLQIYNSWENKKTSARGGDQPRGWNLWEIAKVNPSPIFFGQPAARGKGGRKEGLKGVRVGEEEEEPRENNKECFQHSGEGVVRREKSNQAKVRGVDGNRKGGKYARKEIPFHPSRP